MARIAKKDKTKTYRVFLSAAEPSGDGHCANLITALQKRNYNFEFVGVGGEKMAQAGCDIIEFTTRKAAMGEKAFLHIWHFFKIIMRINRFFKTTNIDLVILCDSPAFNFHIAKAAKKHGIKTLFYVAPQLWAWGDWRMKKLKANCDKLCCILPFEKDYFAANDIDVTFVGNPMLEDLDPDFNTNIKDFSDFNPDNFRLAILPGSRMGEILNLWRPMQQLALSLKRKFPNMTITTVAVDDAAREILKAGQIIGFRSNYSLDTVYDTCKESDFAIVASGSATLQVAAAGCPMVVMYQSSKLLWQLVGRWLIKTKFLSLVNILAQKELVPEFMPYFDNLAPIHDRIIELLRNNETLSQTSSELVKLVEPLGKTPASQKTSLVAVKLLE